MGDQVMSINTDVVGAAVNELSVITADIQTRNKKFLELLNQKNEATQGKFALLAKLEEKVADEVNNFNKALSAQDDIKVSLQRYIEMFEEANDDSAFNR